VQSVWTCGERSGSPTSSFASLNCKKHKRPVSQSPLLGAGGHGRKLKGGGGSEGGRLGRNASPPFRRLRHHSGPLSHPGEPSAPDASAVPSSASSTARAARHDLGVHTTKRAPPRAQACRCVKEGRRKKRKQISLKRRVGPKNVASASERTRS
jgi:hypothetical protein